MRRRQPQSDISALVSSFLKLRFTRSKGWTEKSCGNLCDIQVSCIKQSVCQVHLTNNITPTVQTPSLKRIKERSLPTCLLQTLILIQQCRSSPTPRPAPVTERETPTWSCSSFCSPWPWVLCLLQMDLRSSCSVETVPCSGSASTTAATSTCPHSWPGLMQSSTVCQREPTWCLSTVWMKRILSKPWSRTSTMLKEVPGSDSAITTKKAAGCGLMVVRWNLPFGPQESQTTMEEMKAVFKTTITQIRNGMIINVQMRVPSVCASRIMCPSVIIKSDLTWSLITWCLFEIVLSNKDTNAHFYVCPHFTHLLFIPVIRYLLFGDINNSNVIVKINGKYEYK